MSNSYSNYTLIKIIDERPTGILQLVKEVNSDQLFTLFVSTPCKNLKLRDDIEDQIIMEFDILKLFTSEYLVRVKEYFFDSKSKTFIWVMDPIEGKSLSTLIEKNNIPSEDQLQNIISQVAQGLEDMHSRDIYHGELSLDNIFVNNQGQCKILIKGDCSQNGILSNNAIEKKKVILDYQSPEQRKSGEASMDSDLYNLGLVLYYFAYDQNFTLQNQLNNSKNPLQKNKKEFNSQMLIHNERLKIKQSTISFQAICGLLQFSPKDRISLSKIIHLTSPKLGQTFGLEQYLTFLTINDKATSIKFLPDLDPNKILKIEVKGSQLKEQYFQSSDYLKNVSLLLAACPNIKKIVLCFEHRNQSTEFYNQSYDIEVLVLAINAHNSIKELDVNFLQGATYLKNLDHFFEQICRLKNIESLRLNLDELRILDEDDRHVRLTFQNCFHNLKALQAIEFSLNSQIHNRLELASQIGIGIASIKHQLKQLKIQLYYSNRHGFHYYEDFLASLIGLYLLENLDLQLIIKQRDLQIIPKIFKSLLSLRTLKLQLKLYESNDKLTNEPFEQIIHILETILVIPKLTNLELNLSDEFVNYSNIQSISNIISKLTQLTSFSASSQIFSFERDEQECYVRCLKQMCKLEKLKLRLQEYE